MPVAVGAAPRTPCRANRRNQARSAVSGQLMLRSRFVSPARRRSAPATPWNPRPVCLLLEFLRSDPDSGLPARTPRRRPRARRCSCLSRGYSCPMIAKFAPPRTCTKVNKRKIVRRCDQSRAWWRIRARGGHSTRREPARFARSGRRCTTSVPSPGIPWIGNKAHCRIPTRAILSRPV